MRGLCLWRLRTCGRAAARGGGRGTPRGNRVARANEYICVQNTRGVHKVHTSTQHTMHCRVYKRRTTHLPGVRIYDRLTSVSRRQSPSDGRRQTLADVCTSLSQTRARYARSAGLSNPSTALVQRRRQPRRVYNVMEGDDPARTPQRLEVTRRQPVAMTAVNKACPRRGPIV